MYMHRARNTDRGRYWKYRGHFATLKWFSIAKVWMYVPGKTGLIYTKYICSHYCTYLLFCMCYPNSVSFIEFLMDFCILCIWRCYRHNTDIKLYYKLSKSGQILHVDKISFPRPVTNYISMKRPYVWEKSWPLFLLYSYLCMESCYTKYLREMMYVASYIAT